MRIKRKLLPQLSYHPINMVGLGGFHTTSSGLHTRILWILKLQPRSFLCKERVVRRGGIEPPHGVDPFYRSTTELPAHVIWTFLMDGFEPTGGCLLFYQPLSNKKYSTRGIEPLWDNQSHELNRTALPTELFIKNDPYCKRT